MKHVVIIGNGVSGIATARHLRKLCQKTRITVISGETKHHYSRTALMYIYMGHMRFEDTKPYPDDFWEKNNIHLKQAWVRSIDFDNKLLSFDSNEKLSYDKLVIATGSKPNMFGWPGQDLKGVSGLYSFQDLENMEAYTPSTKRAVIVGGGLIGLEMAEMFLSRGIEVSFLVREGGYWSNVLPKGESNIVTKHIKEHHVDLRLATELDEIIGDGNGRVKAIKTKTGEQIECQYVGLTAGVHPNIKWIVSDQLETNRGILVNDQLETNIKDVYAIGDCAELKSPKEGRRALEQVWYTGKIMGETLAHTLNEHPMDYNPGLWYNSAKFFDIEYQTYGTVLAKNPEGIVSLYWENEAQNKCIHIVYDKTSKQVVGVNLFGTRHRHQVWEHWIKNRTSIEQVLRELNSANFDPEFFKTYEEEVIALYNKQEGTAIQPKSKRGLTGLVKILRG